MYQHERCDASAACSRINRAATNFSHPGLIIILAFLARGTSAVCTRSTCRLALTYLTGQSMRSSLGTKAICRQCSHKVFCSQTSHSLSETGHSRMMLQKRNPSLGADFIFCNVSDVNPETESCTGQNVSRHRQKGLSTPHSPSNAARACRPVSPSSWPDALRDRSNRCPAWYYTPPRAYRYRR